MLREHTRTLTRPRASLPVRLARTTAHEGVPDPSSSQAGGAAGLGNGDVPCSSSEQLDLFDLLMDEPSGEPEVRALGAASTRTYAHAASHTKPSFLSPLALSLVCCACQRGAAGSMTPPGVVRTLK